LHPQDLKDENEYGFIIKLEIFFFIKSSRIFERTLLFGRFPGFDLLSLWKEQRVDEDDGELGE